MNAQISHYVDEIQAAILYELVTTDTSNLYDIARQLIAENEADTTSIYQAVEVVKHQLVG